MALHSSRARIKIFGDAMGRQIGAPFEVAMSYHVQQCGDTWTTQRLMGESNAVGLGSYCVCEEGNLCGAVDMGVGNNGGS